MAEVPHSGNETIELHYALIKDSNLLGKHSKLMQLFEFLMQGRDMAPPTEQVLAREVFGKQDTATSDDSSVRVYMYRLRKKFDEFYRTEGSQLNYRITIPKGAYSLQFAPHNQPALKKANNSTTLLRISWGTSALLLAFIVLQGLIWKPQDSGTVVQNHLWQSLRNSSKPIIVLLGDYYLIGEVENTDSGEHLTRYVRDFRVNNALDLQLWNKRKIQDFANMKAIDITYLPLSVGFALGHLLDNINQLGRAVKVLNVSDANADIIKGNDVIYIGLVSGMGFLSSIVFDSAHLVPGMGYDELVNTQNNQRYRTSEPYGRVEGYVYKDYAYVNVLRNKDGIVLTIAGLRDTGLKAISEVLAAKSLSSEIQAELNKPQGELLFAVPGLQQSPIGNPELISLTDI